MLIVAFEFKTKTRAFYPIGCAHPPSVTGPNIVPRPSDPARVQIAFFILFVGCSLQKIHKTAYTLPTATFDNSVRYVNQ